MRIIFENVVADCFLPFLALDRELGGKAFLWPGKFFVFLQFVSLASTSILHHRHEIENVIKTELIHSLNYSLKTLKV